MHGMVDIETLDTKDSAVVFQIGFIVFDPKTYGKVIERIYHLDILDQVLAGRTIDPGTVGWWNQQPRGSWEERYVFPNPICSLHDALTSIAIDIKDHGITKVWSNSPSFDAVILRSAARSLGITEFPWDFRKDMDLRTIKEIARLLDVAGYLQDLQMKEMTHHALQDCRDQIETLRICSIIMNQAEK